VLFFGVPATRLRKLDLLVILAFAFNWSHLISKVLSVP